MFHPQWDVVEARILVRAPHSQSEPVMGKIPAQIIYYWAMWLFHLRVTYPAHTPVKNLEKLAQESRPSIDTHL